VQRSDRKSERMGDLTPCNSVVKNDKEQNQDFDERNQI
jgi:hypothetical protein